MVLLCGVGSNPRVTVLAVALVAAFATIIALSVMIARYHGTAMLSTTATVTTPSITFAPSVAGKLSYSGVMDAATEQVLTSVIPLTWDPSTGTYNIHFFVGNNLVHAAFDTGSAHVVVSTDACSSCSGPTYDPHKSQSSYAVVDSRRGEGAMCRAQISYVSQSNTLQMYTDTVTIPRALAPDCLGRASVPSDGTVIPSLVVHDFPIGGIVHNTGQSSVNVFGMSGVVTPEHPETTRMYTLPTCQLSTEPMYESPILQAVFMYTKAHNEPMVWAVRFAPRRSDGATVMFRQQTSACDRPLVRVKAVTQLPDGASDLVRTPYRYYAIEVVRARTYHGSTPLPHFPRIMLVDTATTQVMVPGQTDAALLNRNGLVLTVRTIDGSDRDLEWPLSSDDSHLGVPMFMHMPDETANEFSHTRTVGILGVMAMRGRYIEFAFDEPRTIAFA